MHGQEIEDIVSTLHTRCLFPISLLEEQLYTGLKLLIIPSHLFLHHDYDLVIVLHSKESLLQRSELVAKRTDFYLLYGCLEFFYYCFLFLLFEHVDSSCEEDIGEAVA